MRIPLTISPGATVRFTRDSLLHRLGARTGVVLRVQQTMEQHLAAERDFFGHADPDHERLMLTQSPPGPVFTIVEVPPCMGVPEWYFFAVLDREIAEVLPAASGPAVN